MTAMSHHGTPSVFTATSARSSMSAMSPAERRISNSSGSLAAATGNVTEPCDLIDRATLWTSSNYYVIEDCSRNSSSLPFTTIDRLSKTVTHEAQRIDEGLPADYSGSSPGSTTLPFKIHIHGIMGSIELLSGPYLIVIRDRKFVGKVYDHDIWEISSTEVLPFAKNQRHLSALQIENERHYIELLQSTISRLKLYFSYSYDLTHTLQKLHSSGQKFYSSSLFNRADQRFCWNEHLQSHLQSFGNMERYHLPIMCGFVEVTHPISINGSMIEITLISRRNHRRAGTRFNTRGIDRAGNVANFVESEQIVKVAAYHLSYVQTRGSIPMFWKQVPTLKYKPPIEIAATNDHTAAARRHLSELRAIYGRPIIISLIDQAIKKHEGDLARRFSDCMDQLQDMSIQFYPFDFHKECSKMRWDRLSLLMERVRSDHQAQGSFIARTDKSTDMVQIIRFQKGVIRSNCIDSLDRTNVVQTMLAKEALTNQLQQLSIFSPAEQISNHQALLSTIHNIWADNADVLSEQYAGSPALKTDYTRTGKRTLKGMLADLRSSFVRYIRNNLFDGAKQDGINLLLGDYQVNPNEGVSVVSPLEPSLTLIHIIPPVVLLCCIGILSVGSVYPDDFPILGQIQLPLLFLVLILIAFMFRQAKKIVNTPRLVLNLSH